MITDILDLTEITDLLRQARHHQLMAQIGRQYASDVHLVVDAATFDKLFSAGLLHRTETGFWSLDGALLWLVKA